MIQSLISSYANFIPQSMQLLQSTQGDIKIMAANNSEQQLVKYQQVIQNDQLLPVWVRKIIPWTLRPHFFNRQLVVLGSSGWNWDIDGRH
jgi:hypothetical protein